MPRNITIFFPLAQWAGLVALQVTLKSEMEVTGQLDIIGKYTYLLSCKELNEKIDTTVMPVH